MRILVLNKRQYTGKDLLDDKYGRLYEIPEALAIRGNEVKGLTLSYRPRAQGLFSPGRVQWNSVNLFSFYPAYLRALTSALDSFHPDIVIASSDAIHSILAWQFCSNRSIPYIIDLYDNYEGFGLARIPGVVPLLRAACRSAAGITVVGHQLRSYLERSYELRSPVEIINNAIPAGLFVPQPKNNPRALLGLPQHAKLIGTAGAISAKRGSDIMFKAFLELAQRHSDIWLVYAGPRDHTPQQYKHERIIDLGVLDYSQVPTFLSALDVSLICNIDSAFGRYCFPQKFYEIAACGVPVIAADIGEVRHLLANREDCLYPVGDSHALAARIQLSLQNPAPVQVDAPSWSDAAMALENFISRLLK